MTSISYAAPRIDKLTDGQPSARTGRCCNAGNDDWFPTEPSPSHGRQEFRRGVQSPLVGTGGVSGLGDGGWLRHPPPRAFSTSSPSRGREREVLDDLRYTAWALPRPVVVHRARYLVCDLLTALDVSAEVIGEVEIVVAELATNALLHGRRPYELRVLCAGATPFAAEVADADPNLDGIPTYLAGCGPSLEDLAGHEGGRGLRIVHAFTAGRCGARVTTLCGTGQPAKGVWFALPAPHQEATNPCS